MVPVTLLAQALPSASSGVDWLYQFTNNLTNLTTQNGGALTQLGLTELSCIALFTLISMVVNWNTTSMTLRFHAAPVHAGDLVNFLLPARKLLGESVPRRELWHQSLLQLHRAGDGCGL
jgi:type IV secretion system protein VirB6